MKAISLVIVLLVFLALIMGTQFISRVDDDKALQLFKALARTQDVEIVTKQTNASISTDTTYQLRIQGKLASGHCTGSTFNGTTCIITWAEK